MYHENNTRPLPGATPSTWNHSLRCSLSTRVQSYLDNTAAPPEARELLLGLLLENAQLRETVLMAEAVMRGSPRPAGHDDGPPPPVISAPALHNRPGTTWYAR
jgi:hypothetical protein